MIKARAILIILTIVLFGGASATASVLAQDEPPPAYAGLENPFPWSDTSAQEAGKRLYRQSCLGCHGINGGGIATADFANVDYPQSLAERPDYYFWLLSEGRLDRGMPPFKSSFSEEERWQMLTFIWSLGEETPAEVTPSPTEPAAETENGTLLLTVPEQAEAGKPLVLRAVLRNSQDQPINDATVKFFIRIDFFVSDLIEIGEMGQAPTSAFYLPGGIISWLLIVVATVLLIWVTYFRVLYQVFRIPIVSEITDTDTRLVPLAGLAIIVVIGLLLALMLLTGPYSHSHLLP